MLNFWTDFTGGGRAVACMHGELDKDSGVGFHSTNLPGTGTGTGYSPAACEMHLRERPIALFKLTTLRALRPPCRSCCLLWFVEP